MRRIRHSLALIAISVLFISCGSPDQQGKALPPTAQVMVNATSRLVTMDVKNAPLTAVLAAMGQQAQITLSLSDDIKSERLNLSFQNIPLEDALKRVLAGQSYILVYKQDTGRNVISGVRLFVKHEQVPPTNSAPSNQGGSTMNKKAVAAVSDDVPLNELKRSFSETKDPALRSAMLEAMANRGKEGPVAPALAMALSDIDEGVRTDALNHLKMTSEPVPLGPLAQMAATDSNPDLRMEAMTLMADQLSVEERTKEDWAVAQASLVRSLSDPNQHVRKQAEMLLSDLSQ